MIIFVLYLIFSLVNPSISWAQNSATHSAQVTPSGQEQNTFFLTEDLSRLQNRLEAAVLRIDRISKFLEIKEKDLKDKGIKNSRITRAVTAVTKQNELIKENLAEVLNLILVLQKSSNLKTDYARFRTKSLAIVTQLKKALELQTSAIEVINIYEKK